jgi:hypothetical protein
MDGDFGVFESNRRRRRADANHRLMMAVFARMDPVAMMAAMGVAIGLGLFLATAILLLKGAPLGMPIGPNLSALATFLPGFSVTWVGAGLGGVYGFMVGAVLGFILSVLWNFTHIIFIGMVVLRGNWLE